MKDISGNRKCNGREKGLIMSYKLEPAWLVKNGKKNG